MLIAILVTSSQLRAQQSQKGLWFEFGFLDERNNAQFGRVRSITGAHGLSPR